jgi:hypothetical protein
LAIDGVIVKPDRWLRSAVVVEADVGVIGQREDARLGCCLESVNLTIFKGDL